MIPAFNACTESPEPGISTSSTVSAIPITSTSLCPAPTVSSRIELLAGGIEEERRLQRRLGEPAEMAARAHRPDEHARIEEVVGKPIRSPSSAPRVKGLDGSTEITPTVSLLLAHLTDQRRDQGRLPHARRARDADHEGCARLRIQLLDELVRERVAVLDQRDRARERSDRRRARRRKILEAQARRTIRPPDATGWSTRRPRISEPSVASARRLKCGARARRSRRTMALTPTAWP